MFLVVPDENDHFVGGQPLPVGCDGITTPCTYTQIGEITAILNRLLITQRSNTTPFLVHSDDAPTVYVTGNPGPTAAVTRTLEQDLNLLIATNPITGHVDRLSAFLADQAEMKLLHMITTSPARTPTLTMFGNPDYFFVTGGTANCALAPACIIEQPGFAWNHGDVQKDITRTWLAMVGPGVRREGRNDEVFSDHTDVRPTMLALLGLKDDYVHDGRVLAEKLFEQALPSGIRRRREDFIALAKTYKQLNAPLGSVGRNSLVYANRSITSDDAIYAQYLTKLGAVTSDRDSLAAQIKTALDAAAFANQPLDEQQQDGLARRARKLIDQVGDLAENRRREAEGRD